MKFCSSSLAASRARTTASFRLRLAPGRVAVLGLVASAAAVTLPLLAPGPLAALAPAWSVSAQAQVAGPIVRAIEIQYAGPATVSRERLLGNMRTTVGQPFTQSAVEDDVRSLYATGDITNVRIFSDPQGDGVKVIVVVQTRSTIRQIDIVGAQKLKPRALKRKLTSKIGGVLNEEVVETDRQKIVSLYQDRGFSDVNVQAQVDVNEQAGNAAVTFTVNEGGKSVLREVVFEGNAHVKTSELRKAM
ncbi:MAG: hypothetical protein JO117_05605, partial [Verrucomicrobia bacterium]|nr:hypothetical protein [Verrucomicrobiota bacterium]